MVHILEHPASTQEAKDRAEKLRPELEAQLTSPQIEAARQRGRNLAFELIVAEALQPTNPPLLP